MTASRGTRATPLHAARAGVGLAWCLILAAAALSLEHPVPLAVVLGVVICAAVRTRVGRPVGRALVWGVPFAVAIAVLNALVTREGLTVILRGWTVPPFGVLDVTLEGLVYGGVLGLRALVLLGVCALVSAVVDPDALLRGLRRMGLRSGLAAALAMRLVPVLARDARRVADAQRCRPDGGASRLALVRALSAGALERSLDLAATLEVRGFASARRAPRVARPWSRHDLAFAASALAVAALLLARLADDPAAFAAYPRLSLDWDAGLAAWLAALAVLAVAPFAQRRGVGA